MLLDQNICNIPGITGLNPLDESIDLHIARLELVDEVCALRHGPDWAQVEAPPAVDYLCQYFGFKGQNTGDGNAATDLLRIPICEECVRGLYDENEVLIYCISCNNSQWVWKPDSKLNYNTNVVWVDMCPKCQHLKEE